MSPSVTSDRRVRGWLATLLAAAWQLAQVFWVGPLVALHLCIPVALAQAGWAPLLIQSGREELLRMMLSAAAGGVFTQIVVLVWWAGVGALWRDLRGQLLLASAAAVLLQNELARLWSGPTALAGYVVLLLCGLILVLQPVPGRPRPNQAV
ncbi:hypothetical protein [Pseudomonas sp. EpS/L25]|uniref:hypothetical protein n=1 Tax=Pseudomonas sp. EpS/L25 TaxID=1749078 RepID=UPI000743B491|nr:hypothetical protein [Pseudomonas sp. EpS/L25]KUM38682.1 hypothetical protein AR540_13310 [Pseudomonas sp. EpS/L25]